VPVLIAYVDRHMVYRFVNKAYEQAVGLDRDEICGRRVDQIIGRESFLEREAHMEGALAGMRQSFEVATLDEDGRQRYAEATYIPQFDADGRVQGFFALFHDITERRRAQQGLKEAYDTLEQRVQDRTRELSEVNRGCAARSSCATASSGRCATPRRTPRRPTFPRRASWRRPVTTCCSR
jgi:PAS domain S-box-containing protein